MAKKQPTVVIIDGNALVHRAFHALPPLTNAEGVMVNAVYGFTTILFRVMKELNPDYIVATFDLAGPTFRHTEYKEYKATRVKAPQELYDQIPLVKELVRAFNIPIFEKKGFEADDLIGTIAKHLYGQPVKTIIVTGDMDTMQLVNEQTFVYTLKKGVGETVTIGPDEVKEKYGLLPSQMIDYKALRGDPSDNIPGVKGIGEKTAVALLQKYETLDALYSAVHAGGKQVAEIKPRILELLHQHEKEAHLSKKLATIICDVPIEFSLEAAATRQYDKEKVIAMLRRFEFKSLLNKLPETNGAASTESAASVPVASIQRDPKKQFILINTDKALADLEKQLHKLKAFAIDTETTGLNEIEDDIIGLSVSWEEDKGFFVHLNHEKRDEWLQKVKPVLENPAIEKTGHNLKFDYKVLRKYGITLFPISFDSMIASYLLNSTSRQHSLDDVAFAELEYQTMPISALLGEKGEEREMKDVPVEDLSWYAAEDAEVAWRLREVLAPQIVKNGAEKVFNTIELPLIPVLAETELAGVKVDVPFLRATSKEYTKKLDALQKDIYRLAGKEFNIQSPTQLQVILFETLKISTQGIVKTKTGLSTAASELEKMRNAHPIVEKILEYREFAKLISTYLDSLPDLVEKQTNRLHTDYNQVVAATGRLSSINPNLQNIPVRTELGRAIRRGFVADRGNQLLSVDYSQLELRIIAGLAKDKKMIETFMRGEDIHARTAAEINEVSLEEVTKEMRHGAKEVNFGVLYGMGVYGLSSRTGISREQAKEFIDKYFSAYKGVAKYLEELKVLARKQGYVETLFGRRRYLPEINAHNAQLRNAAERMAVNMPVQGTEADIVKLAMIKVYQGLHDVSPEGRLILQVHDELVLEVPKSDIQAVASFLKQTMEHVLSFVVPLTVELSVGDNWGEMKALEKPIS